MRDEFLSEEDLDLRNLSWDELIAYWNLWLEQAQATVKALPDCRYVEIPGNHMTMLFGQGAPRIVEAITDFIG